MLMLNMFIKYSIEAGSSAEPTSVHLCSKDKRIFKHADFHT